MKKTSLSDALAKKAVAATPATVPPAQPSSIGSTSSSTSGSGDKGFVYRLSESDWLRLKEIALDQRISLQQFVTDDINFRLQSDGLPPITATRSKK